MRHRLACEDVDHEAHQKKRPTGSPTHRDLRDREDRERGDHSTACGSLDEVAAPPSAGANRHRRAGHYGPDFAEGTLTTLAPESAGSPYPVFVPCTDADGNDLAGIRLPTVAAPRATFTGWALRAPAFGGPYLCDAAGQQIDFAATRAERLANGDPRPSLEELLPGPKGVRAGARGGGAGPAARAAAARRGRRADRSRGGDDRSRAVGVCTAEERMRQL